MDFKGMTALENARSVAFPRATGSSGEEAAVSLIEKKLMGYGYLPQRQEFSIPITPWTLMKGFVVLAMVILVGSRKIAVFSPTASGILTLLIVTFLAFYASFWFKVIGSESVFKWLIGRKKEKKFLRSQNLTAILPAVEKPEQYLYLIAHHDSKSQSLPLLHRAFYLLLAGLTSLWGSFSYIWFSEGTLRCCPSPQVDFPLAVALAAMIPLLLLKTANRSAGALDNAGSLGILLHLAEVLKEKKPLGSEVTFLFTGAEELGLQGAFAYLRKHGRAIRKEKSYFINLDCVGIKGKTRIFSKKGGLQIGRDPSFVSGLKEIGREFKMSSRSFSFGFLMDHQAFLEKGYQAVSLASPSRKILNVHTPRDTVDKLESEGLEEVGKFILAWIQALEKV